MNKEESLLETIWLMRAVVVLSDSASLEHTLCWCFHKSNLVFVGSLAVQMALHLVWCSVRGLWGFLVLGQPVLFSAVGIPPVCHSATDIKFRIFWRPCCFRHRFLAQTELHQFRGRDDLTCWSWKICLWLDCPLFSHVTNMLPYLQQKLVFRSCLNLEFSKFSWLLNITWN